MRGARLPRRRHGADHGRPRPGHRHRRPRPHEPARDPRPLHPLGQGRRAPASSIDEPRFVTDIAADDLRTTSASSTRASPSARRCCPQPTRRPSSPLVFVIPAYNEAANLPAVLASIARQRRRPPRDRRRRRRLDRRHRRGRRGARRRRRAPRAQSRPGRCAAHRPGRGARRSTPAPPSTSTPTASTTPPKRSACSTRSSAARPTTSSARASRASVEGMTLSRRLANRGFSLLLSLLCGRWISDGQTGYPRLLAPRARRRRDRARLQLRAGADDGPAAQRHAHDGGAGQLPARGNAAGRSSRRSTCGACRWAWRARC